LGISLSGARKATTLVGVGVGGTGGQHGGMLNGKVRGISHGKKKFEPDSIFSGRGWVPVLLGTTGPLI
jgi:hypothetical protein